MSRYDPTGPDEELSPAREPADVQEEQQAPAPESQAAAPDPGLSPRAARAHPGFDFIDQAGFDPTELQTEGARTHYAQAIKDVDKDREDEQKQAFKDEQSGREAYYRTAGIQSYVNANGEHAPVLDEAGQPVYHAKKFPVAYDDQGRAIQKERDEAGHVTVKDLDADAPIGGHADNPNLLFKQNKNRGWDTLGTVEDGLKSPYPAIRQAAEAQKVVRDEHLAKEAAQGFKDAQGQIDLKQNERFGAYQAAQRRLNDPRPEFGGKSLTERYQELEQAKQQKQGTWLFGTEESTDAAKLAASEQAKIFNEITEAQAVRAPDKTDEEAFKAAKAANARDAGAFGFLTAQAGGDVNAAAAQFRKQLMDSGDPDPDSHPALARLDATRKKLGMPTLAEQGNAVKALRTNDRQAQADAITAHTATRDEAATRAAEQAAGGPVEHIAQQIQDQDNALAPLGEQIRQVKAQIDQAQAMGDPATAQKLVEKLGPIVADFNDNVQKRNDTLGQLKDVSAKDRAEKVPLAASVMVGMGRQIAKMPEGEEKKKAQANLDEIDQHFAGPDFEEQKRAESHAWNYAEALAQIDSQKMAVEAEHQTALQNVRATKDAPDSRADAAGALLGFRSPTDLYRQSMEAQRDEKLASLDARREQLLSKLSPEDRAAAEKKVSSARVAAAMDLAKGKLDAVDKLADIASNPAQLVPFVHSLPELAVLGDAATAAWRIDGAQKANQAPDPDDMELVATFMSKANQDTTRWHEIINGISMLPAFAGEIGLTGGIYTVGKEGAQRAGMGVLKKLVGQNVERFVARAAEDSAAKIVSKTALKLAGKGAVSMVGSIPQTAVAGAPMIAKGMIERMAMKVSFDSNEAGEIKAKFENQGFVEAGARSFGNAYVEIFSEHTGGAMAEFSGMIGGMAGKVFAKMPAVDRKRLVMATAFKAWKEKHLGGSVSDFSKLMAKGGYHGVVPEWFEERVGDAARMVAGTAEGMLGVKKKSFADSLRAAIEENTPSREQMENELAIFAVPGAMSAVSNAVADRQQAKQQDGVVKNMDAARELFHADAVIPELSHIPSAQAAELGATDTTDLAQTLPAMDAKVDAARQQYEEARSKGSESRNKAFEDLSAAHDERHTLIQRAARSVQISAASQQIDSLTADSHPMLAGATPAQVEDTKAAARGLLKIAAGKPIEALTAHERAAVEAPTQDSLPRIEKVKGDLVITQGAIDRLGELLPDAAAVIGKSESERRAELLNPKPKAGDKSNGQEETGSQKGQQNGVLTPEGSGAAQSAPGSVATAYEGMEKAPADHAKRVALWLKTAGKADPGDAAHFAAKFVQANGVGDYATQKTAALDAFRARKAASREAIGHMDAAKMSGFLFRQAVASAKAEGRELSPADVENAKKVATLMAPAVAEHQHLLDEINVMIDRAGGGGAASAGHRKLTISVGDVVSDDNFATLSDPEAARAIIREEAHHSLMRRAIVDVANKMLASQKQAASIRALMSTEDWLHWQSLGETGRADMLAEAVWRNLPETEKDQVRKVYLDDPANDPNRDNGVTMGHEALRMIAEIKGGFGIREQTLKGLDALQAFFAEIVEYFRQLRAVLTKAGVSKGAIDLIDATTSKAASDYRRGVDKGGSKPYGKRNVSSGSNNPSTQAGRSPAADRAGAPAGGTSAGRPGEGEAAEGQRGQAGGLSPGEGGARAEAGDRGGNQATGAPGGIQAADEGFQLGGEDTGLSAELNRVETVEFPVDQLDILSNFKENADAKTGVVQGQQLQSAAEREGARPVYHRLGFGPIQVWEHKVDGQTRHTVISGRHRLDLARRAGEKTIPAQVIRERDGWTERKVRALDAELNIKDEKGTVKDYVKFFLNTDKPAEQMRREGLFDREKGKQGWDITRHAAGADGSLMQAFFNGQINPEQAQAIANEAPGNNALQAVGVKVAVEGRSADFAREMMRDAKESHGTAEATLDMFGNDDAALQQAEARSKAALSIQAKLKRQLSELNSFKGAAKNPALARQFGIDATDPQAALSQLEQAREKIKADQERWQRWRQHPDLKAQVDAALASPAPALKARAAGSNMEPREVVRLRNLQARQARGELNRYESEELTNLERRAGQEFMPFFDQTRKEPQFSLEGQTQEALSGRQAEQAMLFARKTKPATAEEAASLQQDDKIAKEGGMRTYALGDYTVERSGGEERRKHLDAVWEMYQLSYGAIGTQYKDGHELLGEPLFDVALDAEGKPIAFHIIKITPWGRKGVASGTNGSPDGKRAWRRFLHHLAEPGNYTELSDKPEKIAEKDGLPTIDADEAAELLPGKVLTPDGDTGGYFRNMTINGLTEPHRKRMFGEPRLWEKKSTSQTAIERPSTDSQPNTTTQPPPQSASGNAPRSGMESPTDTSLPETTTRKTTESEEKSKRPTPGLDGPLGKSESPSGTPEGSELRARPAPADIAKQDEVARKAKVLFENHARNVQRLLRPEYLAAVEQDAREGYPGVPGFRPYPGLTPEERTIEAHFAQIIADDPRGTLERYKKLAVADFGIPTYLNADLARMVYPAFASNERLRLSLERSTNAGAGYVALHLGFADALRDPRTKAKPIAMFLAGGPGSGKTTAVNEELEPQKQHCALIYDAPMAGYDGARTAIQRAIYAGLEPEVVFVYRPFETVANGIIDRTVKTNRAVPLTYAGRAHYDAQAVFLRLAREFTGKKVNFKVFFNDGSLDDIREASVDDLRAKSYVLGDESPETSSAQAQVSDRGNGSLPASEAKAGVGDAVRRAPDQGGAGSKESGVLGEPQGEQGGLAGEARQRASESVLGRVGTEAERKADLTHHFAQAINDAYTGGQIDTAHYRALRRGSAAFDEPLALNARRGKPDPNQDGFDFENALTLEPESRKEPQYAPEPSRRPQTNRRPSAGSAPSTGLDDLFERLVGKRESAGSPGMDQWGQDTLFGAPRQPGMGGDSASGGDGSDAGGLFGGSKSGDAGSGGGTGRGGTGRGGRASVDAGGAGQDSDLGGGSRGGGRGAPARVERPEDPALRNTVIPRGAKLSPRGLVSKLRANLDAVETLKAIEAEKRPATQDEREKLLKFSGWGALSQAFDDEKGDRIARGEIAQRQDTAARYREMSESSPQQAYYREEVERQEKAIKALQNWEDKWGDFHRRLKAAFTSEEYRRAQRSTINAHYTAPEYISAMWDMARKLGFKGGNILEPGAGIGHFLGLMPEDMVDRSKLHAIELDDLSGRITRALYPEADVQITGFQTADIADNSIDLAISNVPFANVPVGDKALEAMGGPVENLHDYFFGKTMTKLRPGGLAMFITSSFTLDKLDATTRKWLAERADLVGAYRLPNDAFKENAGTDVVTDIIILRKKDGQPFAHGQSWTAIGDSVTHDGSPIRVNEYFAQHPQNVLGRLADDGEMYGSTDGKEMTVHSDPARPADVALQQAIDALPADIAGEGAAGSARSNSASSDAKVGAIVEGPDGRFYRATDGPTEGAEPDQELNEPKNAPRVRAFIAARDALNNQYDLELDPEASDEDIEQNRRGLNAAYDRFVERFKDFHQSGQKKLFARDPDFVRLLGAEVPEKQAKGGIAGVVAAIKRKIRPVYVKADVFTKRVLEPRVEPSTAATLEDAFGISLGWRGKVDSAYMAGLLGQSQEAVERDLIGRGIALRDPETGQIQSREMYASGNVRKKLDIARASGPDYARNVQVLEDAQPPTVPITEARFKIGATWIPASVYQEFLSSVGVKADVEYVVKKGAEGQDTQEAGQRDYWTVKVRARRGYEQAYREFSTPQMEVGEIMDSLLNMKRLTISFPRGHELAGQEDVNGTSAVKDAAKRLNERFVKWVQGHETIGPEMEKTFNREVNGFALREYDGQHLTFPWASKDFDLFPEKKNAVWRAIQDGFGLFAHGVGGGKTIIGTAIALELRRLGLARKPMIVVHNATLEQFADEIAKIAPAARVLVGRKDELDGDKRREFLMRMASGDWDAVVIAHSTFGMLTDDPKEVERHMQGVIDEIMQSLQDEGYSLAEARDEKKNRSVKERVKTIERLEKKIREATEKAADPKNAGILNFQQLGVDALIVDEVHAFKKMPFATKIDAKGIDSGMSQRGYQMLMRARSIQEKMAGKGVFTMTGTPVTNTLGEIWNQVRLVAPKLVKEYGVSTFDQFVSKFAEVESRQEATASGERRTVERLSKVINLPEWATFFRMAADVRLGSDMAVKNRPGILGGRPQLVAIDRTAGAATWTQYVRDVLQAFEGLTGEDFGANPSLNAVPVQAYMTSRAASIDIRMIEPRAKDEPGSKVNRMLEKAMELYERTGAYSGTQVIFADSFNQVKTSLFDSLVPISSMDIELDPDKGPGTTFNLYADVKAKLVARGVPASEIAIITDKEFDDAKARKRLFDRVNKGEVRFVMGGTDKLGTGVNMQERMIAAHHLDVPWTPAGLEQRDGRVYRQGNIHGEMGVPVELWRYGMVDTLDEALWQKLETKQRFITGALSGKFKGREIEETDEVLSLSEMRSILGGPFGREIFDLQNRTAELASARSGHLTNAANRREEIERAKRYLATGRKEIERKRPQIDHMREVGALVANDGAKVTVNGKGFETKKAAAEAIDATLSDARENALAIGVLTPKPLNSISVNGKAVRLVPSMSQSEEVTYGENGPEVTTKRTVEFSLAAPVGESDVDFGRVTSAATLMARLEELEDAANNTADAMRNNLSRLEQVAAMPEMGAWDQEAEYQRARARLAELEALEQQRVARTPRPGSAAEVTPPAAEQETPLYARAAPHLAGTLDERTIDKVPPPPTDPPAWVERDSRSPDKEVRNRALDAYTQHQDEFEGKFEEWLNERPPMQPLVWGNEYNAFVVTPNASASAYGRQPWRVTQFHKKEVWGHQEFPTKLKAAKFARVAAGGYNPTLLFARGVKADPNQFAFDFKNGNTPAERIKANIGMVDAIASRFSNIPGASMDDVRSQARVALVKAAQGYNPTKGEFQNYASVSVRNALRDLFAKEARYRTAEKQTLDAPARWDESAEETNQASEPDRGADVARDVFRKDATDILQRAIKSLPERLEAITRGIMAGDSMSVIGERLGVSKQSVSNQAKIANMRLRQKLGELGIRGTSDMLNARRANPTESEPFRQWFKNSKVVDEKGAPLVVTHGTWQLGFTEFRASVNRPAFFAETKGYSDHFADVIGGVYPVYLSVKRPLDLTGFGSKMIGFEKMASFLREKGVNTDGIHGLEPTGSAPRERLKAWRWIRSGDFNERIQEAGFDGIKQVEDFNDSLIEDAPAETIAWAVFDPRQIKSAIGNSGGFDHENPSILNARPGRAPELEQAARDLKAGTITRDQFDATIERTKPIRPLSAPPAIPSDEQIRGALAADKAPFVGATRDLPAGTPVGLRLDIPAFRKNGTHVITIHNRATKSSVGKRLGYDGIARVSNPRFFVTSQEKTMEIATGESAKFPGATVEGNFIPSREIPKDIMDWNQAGYDPERHGFFYDRTTGRPIVGGREALSLGSTVFVKDAVLGDRDSFLYARRSRISPSEAEQYFDFAAVPEAKRAEGRALLAQVENGSTEPYVAPAGFSSKEVEEQRAKQTAAYEALLGFDAEGVKKSIAAGVPLSTLMTQFAKREIESFDIRGAVIATPADVLAHMALHRSPFFESLKIIVLDENAQVLHSQIMTVGTLNEALVGKREIFGVIAHTKSRFPNAQISGFVISHNHPSGDVSPSDADRRVTRALVHAGELIGVRLLDHVITNGKKYYSFMEQYDADLKYGKPAKPGDMAKPARPAPAAAGKLADWEAIELPKGRVIVADEMKVAGIAKTLRTADPDHLHVLLLDTKMGLIGVNRYSAAQAKNPELIAMDAATAGAKMTILSLPSALTDPKERISDEEIALYASLLPALKMLEVTPVDVQNAKGDSFAAHRLLEAPALASRRGKARPEDKGFDPYEAIRALQELANGQKSGERTVGRPDLALGASDPQVMGVDEFRKDTFKPETREQWMAEAQALLADRPAIRRRIIERGLAGGTLSPAETFAAKQIVAEDVKRVFGSADPEARKEVAVLINAYRETGTTAARELASRFDPFKTPEERHREFLAKAIFTPPADVRAKIDAAKTPEERKKILEDDQARVTEIEKALAKMGVSLADILNGEVALRLKGAAFVDNTTKAFAAKEREAIRMIQANRSWKDIAKHTGLTEGQIKAAERKLFDEFLKKHLGKFKNGATAANVDMDALSARPLNARTVSDSEAMNEARRAFEAMGFGRGETQGKKPVNLKDPTQVVKIARTIQAVQSNAFDMLYEFWINAILSGPATHSANIVGNAGNAAWDMTVQRGMEAVLNAAWYHDPESAQLGELHEIARGIMPGVSRGLRLASQAWDAETDFFRHDVLGEPIQLGRYLDDKGGNVRGAIPGKVGRVVRVPGRALLWADAFFKGLIGQMQTGAEAYRIAKAEGLTGDARRVRIAELVDTPNSAAWQKAVEKATVLTFQQDLKSARQGGNVIEDMAYKLQNARNDNRLLAVIVPFVKTPFNIFRQGLRKSPLGAANLLTQFAKAGFYKIRDGKPIGESYVPADQIKHFAEQALAWAVMGLIYGAVQGDDDDDKKKLLITGSMPRTETRRGERDLQQRAYGGDYTIRIGGRNGTTLHYGRFEPFATVIGTTVDALRQVKRDNNLHEKLDAMIGYFVAQIESKTFVQGIANVIEAIQDPENKAKAFGKGLLSSMVPNLIRQPLRNLDEYQRDTRGAGMTYQMLPAAGRAEKRADVYGNDVVKAGGPLARLFVTTPTQPYPELEHADALLLAWNQKNPAERWAPEALLRKIKLPDGTSRDMTPAEYREASQTAGRLVRERLRNRITAAQIANPKEQDVKLIKDAFEEARKAARASIVARTAKSPRLDARAMMFR